MTIKRTEIGRSLTWKELDANFIEVDSLVTQAAQAVNSAITQAGAAASSANSAAQILAATQEVQSQIQSQVGGVPALLARTVRTSGAQIQEFNLEDMKGKVLGFNSSGVPTPFDPSVSTTVDSITDAGVTGKDLLKSATQVAAQTVLGVDGFNTRITNAETSITNLNTKTDATNTAVTGNFARTLRVGSSESIAEIPSIANRKGKILGFDATTGAPVAVNQSSEGSGGTQIAVASVTALRALEPTTDGQTAYLKQYDAQRPVAGGTFVYDASDTTTADDGGWCFVTAGGKRWKRQTDCLLLAHYGYTSVDYKAKVDIVPKFKAYIEALRALDQPICDIRIGTYARLKSEIVFSDDATPHISVLRTERSNTFKVNPAEFVAPTGVTGTAAEKWAICFGDRSKTDGQGRLTAFHIEGYLAVENDGSRKTPVTDYMNGIYVKMTWGQVGVLRAFKFRGTGIWVCATWDSTIESLSAELCGHEDNASAGSYCMRLSGNSSVGTADTFNATHIKRLQTEQAFGHGLYISQTVRCEIDNLHMERMTITKPQNETNGHGHVIVCGNSVFGQAVIDRAPITNPVNDTDGVAQLDTNLVVRIGANNSTFNGWLVEGSVFISESFGTTFVGMQTSYLNCPAPAKHITFIGCRVYWYATIESQITLIDCHLGFTLQGRSNYVYADSINGVAEVMAGLRMGTNAQDCKITGGRIARLNHSNDNFGGHVFTDVMIMEQVQHVARPKPQPYATPYTFIPVTVNNSTQNNNQVQAIGAKGPTIFQNCLFYGGNDALAAGADATYGGAVAAKPAIIGDISSHMVIKGGWVRSMDIVANCVVELLDNVQVGKLTMPSTAATNAVRTDGCMCRDVTNWNLPLAATWPVGTMVKRCGANPTSGQGVIYACIDSTTKTTASWAALYTAA